MVIKFYNAGGCMSTIYSQARQRRIQTDSSLKDRRALYFDEIGISINVLKMVETDPSYIPHPNVSAKLITYYQDTVLAKDVCNACPITKTRQELNLLYNDSSFKSNNIHSIYNHSFTIKSRRIIKELKSKNKQKSFYYYARLQAALINHNLSNKYNVQLITGCSNILLSQLENNKAYIPQIDVSNNLLRLYKSNDLARKICNNCPVQQAHNYLINKDKVRKGGN